MAGKLISGRTPSTDTPRELPTKRELCYKYDEGISVLLNLINQPTALVSDFTTMGDFGVGAVTILNNHGIAADIGSFVWQVAKSIEGNRDHPL